ncbi:MAG: DUF5916 domain-containing protein [Rhodothermales bacterium]
MRAPVCFLLSLLLTSAVAAAPDGDDDEKRRNPEVRAVRIAAIARPVLDGKLDDAAWATAEMATGFTQMRPDPGAASTQRTESYVLYDDDALYVGFRCHDDAPEQIVRRLARRDDWNVSDKVLVSIDSYGDGRTAFAFGVNAAGVKYDFLIYNDSDEDNSWDAVWDVAVASDVDGWTAEFRIPLSQLRFQTGDGPQQWGIEFQRDIARNDEKSFWAPLLPDVDGYVSRFGTLGGLEGLASPRRLEVQPYVATRLTREPGDGDDPFYRENAVIGSAGADLKYGITSNLTLSATINPDFGQVEADPAVVNLSAFEVFFEERRPFFVEGVDVFEFGRTRGYTASYRPTFFYSRRIGRRPQRGLSGDEYVYVDAPDQTTIATAAKLSGKVGNWSVGVLNAVTLEEQARYIDPSGDELRSPVEPLTNYAVGRVKRDFRGGNSVVGGLFTATNRSMSEAAFEGITPGEAYVGGLDFEHAWGNRSWAVSGVVAGSYVAGSIEVIDDLQRAPQRYLQRPDAGHLALDPGATSLSGTYGEFSVAKTGGKLIGSVTTNLVSAGFDVNDLGFQFRSDAYALSGIVIYNENEPGVDWLRRWGGNVNWNVSMNGDGQVINRGINFNSNVQLSNLWGGGLYVGGVPAAVYNDRLTRGGPAARRPADIGVNPWIYSDPRKAVSGEAYAFLRTEFVDNPEYDVEFGTDITVRPNSSLELTISPDFSRQFDTDQYLTSVESDAAAATFGTRYVFGDIEQTSFSVGLRANWTFTPELSLQLYARPFVTAGRYSGYKEFAAPGTYDFDVYGVDRGSVAPGRIDEVDGADVFVPDADGDAFQVQPGDGGEAFTLDDPDFNFRSLRGSAVVRWEYRPGSALFFVWQQQRDGFENFGDFRFGRDFGAIFREDVQNIFLIKATYWLGT